MQSKSYDSRFSYPKVPKNIAEYMYSCQIMCAIVIFVPAALIESMPMPLPSAPMAVPDSRDISLQ